ncbi:Uma2 family endonuclease [Streptomyces sp. GMY02]|uniref:Uma2 family endonuclease n=1 Tax=Streptomyces sp. GMY02 TaxID=1333528 RepID=UPI001C2C4746|nr:Uma2 family endonuclease [Streptomyces sp. GMY02]QXE35558.1 Uma2 family endonuclease [Streptomyces sp. GMY02]
MTGAAERAAQMSVEEFEKIAKLVDKVSDTVELEFLGGQICFKATTDADCKEITTWLRQRCTQVRTELRLYAGGELGLLVGADREGRAGVLMAAEIASYETGSEIDRRHHTENLAAYAAAGIPVHLLIDRDHGTVTVHSDPAADGYRDRHVMDFGVKVLLPDPVGIGLDTEELKGFVR